MFGKEDNKSLFRPLALGFALLATLMLAGCGGGGGGGSDAGAGSGTPAAVTPAAVTVISGKA